VSRLPVAAFVALVIATVGAFFVVQHLKVTTPLISGFPAPAPSTINPVAAAICPVRNGKAGRPAPTSFRRMKVSFYLLNRADNVDVYIDHDGINIVTLPGSGRYMKVKKRHTFVWNGRLDGGAVAPDGTYYIRVSLVHQGRTLIIANQSTGGLEPVTVDTARPAPVVTGVSPVTFSSASASPVTIRYRGAGGVRPQILIYRVGSGTVRLVKQYAATSRSGMSLWDGTIDGHPARAGTYVIGVRVTNKACTTGSSPVTTAGAPHAVVTVG
jgi:hypothetical protein